MKKVLISTTNLLMYIMLLCGTCSFAGESSETTPLLKSSKQENIPATQLPTVDHLSELTLPIQLNLLEYIAGDDQEGLKTIKALSKTNKHFNRLCGKLDLLTYKRGPALEKLLAQNLKITPKNVKRILEIAETNNDKTTIQKVYNALNYQSNWKDNCQDCCVCVLPWYKSPWEKEWDESCQENYQKRIQQKYGIEELNNPSDVEDYKNYKESRKYYLGAGLCLLMCSARTIAQLIFCPACCITYMTCHDCCHKESERKNFVEGKTICGWLLWPYQNIFQCLTATSEICNKSHGDDWYGPA